MRVSVVSDVICPWCRIGKANLTTAAEQWTKSTGEPIEVQFLPYLLDPVQPGEQGEKVSAHDALVKKGMSEEQVTAMFDRVTQAGAQQGLRFDYDKVVGRVDTIPAHELMELTPLEKRNALMDSMMTAYFEHGQDIGEPDVLLTIAKGAGLTDDEIAAIEPDLRNRTLEPQVRGMIQQVQRAGVQGVPFFVIDDVLAVSGAQPPDVFVQAFQQAKETEAAQGQQEA